MFVKYLSSANIPNFPCSRAVATVCVWCDPYLAFSDLLALLICLHLGCLLVRCG